MTEEESKAESEDEPEEERRVSWAELFFDLVFVVAITRTSQLVAADTSPGGLLRALIAFVPIYWLWVGTAIHTNLSGTEAVVVRLRLLALALAAIFMAIALPAAYDDRALLFALAYWVGRIVLGVPVMMRSRTLSTPYGMSVAVTGPVLVVGALLGGTVQEIVWGAAALLDLATPVILGRTLSRIHYNAAHLVERFGLLLLIALGESLVAVASSSPEQVGVRVGLAVAVTFVLVAGLWWLHFQYASDAMRFAVARAEVQIGLVRVVLSYGHLVLIGSVILVSVGVHEAIQHPTESLPGSFVGLLYGGVAAYCSVYVGTRWAMFRLVSWTRLTAALIVLVLLPVGLHVDALPAVAVLAAILVALNAVEWWRVEGHRKVTPERA